MSTTISSITATKLSVIWRALRTSAALNAKGVSESPGIARGFVPEVFGPSEIILQPDEVLGDSVMVVHVGGQYSITYREPGPITLLIPDGQVSYVGVIVDYSVGADTTAEWVYYTEAEFLLGNPDADGAVLVCRVDCPVLPGPPTLDFADISLANDGFIRAEQRGSSPTTGGVLVPVMSVDFGDPLARHYTLGSLGGVVSVNTVDYLSGAGSTEVTDVDAFAAITFGDYGLIPVRSGDRLVIELVYKTNAVSFTSGYLGIALYDDGGSPLAPILSTLSDTFGGWKLVRKSFAVEDPTAALAVPNVSIQVDNGDILFDRMSVYLERKNDDVVGLDGSEIKAAATVSTALVKFYEPNLGAGQYELKSNLAELKLTKLAGGVFRVGTPGAEINQVVHGYLNVDDLVTMTTGGQVLSGGFQVLGGDLNVTPGDITVPLGDIIVTAGGITVTAGDVDVTAGALKTNVIEAQATQVEVNQSGGTGADGRLRANILRTDFLQDKTGGSGTINVQAVTLAINTATISSTAATMDMNGGGFLDVGLIRGVGSASLPVQISSGDRGTINARNAPVALGYVLNGAPPVVLSGYNVASAAVGPSGVGHVRVTLSVNLTSVVETIILVTARTSNLICRALPVSLSPGVLDVYMEDDAGAPTDGPFQFVVYDLGV